LGRALISSDRIARRVREMGGEISEVYRDIDTPLVLVVILKGATVFAADLLRSLTIPAELEFVRAASYGSGTSPGKLKLAHMVEGSMVGRQAADRRHHRLGPHRQRGSPNGCAS
jgi:hypoxanthine phosphoribosyltransferase